MAGGGTRTYFDESIQIIAELGRVTARTSAEFDFHEAQRDTLSSLRDSLSGVSLQEELAQLSQFQRAAQASTKFISTVDTLLGSLIQSL